MSIAGLLVKGTKYKSWKLQNKIPFEAQKVILESHLKKSKNTFFGREYSFAEILEVKDVISAFQQKVPIHTYESISKWWKMSLMGEKNVCWPGKVNYFALSSGTSDGSSKYIPVTQAMLKAMQSASMKQMRALAHCKISPNFIQRDILMLGGSTDLDRKGLHYEGDLSGITTGRLPFWFRPFYKPGKMISQTKDWQAKLDLIVNDAYKWDVGAIVGVPSWFQLLFEKIIKQYKLENIHEIWPNLQLFVHGGVSFDPYRKNFETLLGKPLIYLETYLASEGFIAYQSKPDSEGMRLLTNNRIFYEFIPFNDKNFGPGGNLGENPEVLTINQVEEGKDYALLITTCSGAWRYLIGDVIRFVDLRKKEIRITGRTKHFLSLCGEHLSVDNMNRAVKAVADHFDIKIKEFTVAGFSNKSKFGHQWYLGIDDNTTSPVEIKAKLDEFLKSINDDYRVVRDHALEELKVDIVDSGYFVDWLKARGKVGAQVKFPRVLDENNLNSWKDFIATHSNN